jgi:hypothetical protein
MPTRRRFSLDRQHFRSRHTGVIELEAIETG